MNADELLREVTGASIEMESVADRIRERLAEAGWEVRDTPEGARLVRAPPPERGSGGGGGGQS
jgi:hypothetical protein